MKNKETYYIIPKSDIDKIVEARENLFRNFDDGSVLTSIKLSKVSPPLWYLINRRYKKANLFNIIKIRLGVKC